MRSPTEIIGWRERARLPDLCSEGGFARGVRAKVDSGARSSSLHAEHVEVISVRGHERVRFTIVAEDGTEARVEAPLLAMRWVKSSNGSREQRPVIRTRIVLGTHEWMAEVTLTSRDTMGFPMLLGREATRGRFLIDTGRSFLTGRSRKKRPAAEPP